MRVIAETMDARTRTCLVGIDPVPALLASTEPWARWLTLTGVLGLPGSDQAVVRAHADVVAHSSVRTLLEQLPDWEADNHISGHDRPLYAPNLLGLLADMGVAAQDDPRIGCLLDSMLVHQDAEGRFQSFGRLRGMPPAWHSLLCDSHAVTEVLLRFGRGDDPRVLRAVERMSADLEDLAQGRAWPCRPDPATALRGPGRKVDLCPMVTLQALRAFSYVSEEARPGWLADVARVLLRAWLQRGSEKPYMFGHGRQFKRGKWPATWYSALTVLDAVGRYPELWGSPESRAEDVRAVAELAACLIAYNVDSATGMVTPHSCYEGFEAFSFGQKKLPSSFAAARVLAVLARVSGAAGADREDTPGRLADVIEAIAAVDVFALTSSKGGSGTALGP